MQHAGGCHCGAMTTLYETAVAPEATEVRACQCSFCRKHATRAVADPAGRLTITLHDEGVVQRYRFGLGTADYYLCGRCGVYVGAVMPDGEKSYAIAILNAFERPDLFTCEPQPVDYSAEDDAGRRQRRRAGWTPVQIRAAG